jgi:hypothetical protein
MAVKIAYIAAELVLSRLLRDDGIFGDPERRLLYLHLDRSYRRHLMAARYRSVKDIHALANIKQKHYYKVLNPLLGDNVLKEVVSNISGEVCYALVPEPSLWAPRRQPVGLGPELDKLLADLDALDPAKQVEFFEWPTINEGTALWFLEAATAEIYPSTGAEILGADHPTSGRPEDAPGSKEWQRRGTGTTRTELPPSQGSEGGSPSRPCAGQPVDTTLAVVSPEAEGQRAGGEYHRQGGIPSLLVPDTTPAVVSPKADEQRGQTAHLALTPVNRGCADTTGAVVSQKADKQGAERANTTSGVVSPLTRARERFNVGNDNGTNVKERAKGACRCSEQDEARLMEDLEAFFAMPGHGSMGKEGARKEMVNSGKFWRCYVIRHFPVKFEEALGEGCDKARTEKRFNKSRPQFLNWYVRNLAGLKSWSDVKPLWSRD